MTDQQIIDALISRNEKVTQQFFFVKCRPLFMSIISHVFSYNVDYDELVNELYMHLMENDAYRLKQFAGRSTIYQWLKVTAIRYFIAKRNSMIDMQPKESPFEKTCKNVTIGRESDLTSKMDMEYLLGQMQNQRYVYVIRKLVLEDIKPEIVAEKLRINVDNLYNIKKRAIAALTDIAIKEVERYEKKWK